MLGAADTSSVVTGVSKQPDMRRLFGSQIDEVGHHAVLMWISSRHDGSADRLADGVDAVGSLKAHATAGKPIDIRRLQHGMARAPQGIVPMLVGGDQKQVGSISSQGNAP